MKLRSLLDSPHEIGFSKEKECPFEPEVDEDTKLKLQTFYNKN
jgi:hypothetical protein